MGLRTFARCLLCIGLFTLISVNLWAQPSKGDKEDLMLMIFCDPAAGHQAEFDAWWPTYLRELLSSGGLTHVETFQRANARLRRPSATHQPGYMAQFSLAAVDLQRVKQHLKNALSPLIDRDSERIYLYRHTGEWKSAAPEPAGDFYRQLVFGDALAGREEDFNRWYDGTHAADLVTVPGVVAVNRFVYFETVLGSGPTPPKFLSMMDFKTESVEKFSDVLDSMGARFVNTDSFDVTHAWRYLYEQADPESIRQPHD
jgi:hypothetical protein